MRTFFLHVFLVTAAAAIIITDSTGQLLVREHGTQPAERYVIYFAYVALVYGIAGAVYWFKREWDRGI